MSTEPPPPGQNPFSFKNFLSRRVQGDDDNVAKAKKGPKKTKGKQRSDAVLPFPEVSEQKNGGDNPFSFKNFVPKQSQRKPAETSSSEGEEENSSVDSLTKKTPDNIVELTPTFPYPRAEQPVVPKVVNSDSDGSTEEGGPVAPVATRQPVPLVNPPPLGMAVGTTIAAVNDNDDDEFSDEPGDNSVPPPVLRLPSESSTELLIELSKLRAENDELRRSLEKALAGVEKEKKLNSSLKKKIKNLEKKEAEDTKALADMVQKVEENLVLSATRAATAESTISKLKQEILSLQAQLAQANPASMQKHYEELLGGVREKTSYASQRLMLAAQSADHSIKDLLSGVETLKNVAEVLEFVDRIAVLKQT